MYLMLYIYLDANKNSSIAADADFSFKTKLKNAIITMKEFFSFIYVWLFTLVHQTIREPITR